MAIKGLKTSLFANVKLNLDKNIKITPNITPAAR